MPSRKSTKTTKEKATSEKALASHTVDLTSAEMDAVAEWCEQHGWEFQNKPYSDFAYRNESTNLIGYAKERKGKKKLVIQGKGTADWVAFTLEPLITRSVKTGYDETCHPEWFEKHGGMDESGKGDFFGPVVTCTVIADGNMVRYWLENGIQDSKAISSDKKILQLDKLIRSTEGAVVKRMACTMLRYNSLWHQFGKNLNRLLGWQHARCLNAALKEQKVKWALLDKFSDRDHVGPLVKAPADFELRQRTKAESDPVVAAASICARAEFVRRMDALAKTAGVPRLPKGANAEVRRIGCEIVRKHGPKALGQFAKMHFKTAQQVLADA